MKLRTTGTLLALVLAVSVAPAAMAATFEISASDTTPIPERTVEVEGQSFTFDTMVRVNQGDSISIDVSGPDELYDVYLYNSDKSIEASERGSGDESFSFDLSGYEPGSYVVSVYYDGTHDTVQPVLVSGYDVSVDAPSSVSDGESVDVSVDLAATAASSSPANVKVIAAQGGTTHEADATGSDGEYTATFDASTLDEGDYDVYAVAQGDEEAFGEQELLGLSDEHALTVEADSNGDGSNDGGDSPDESDGDESADDGDNDATEENDAGANPPDEETATDADTETDSPTEAVTETDDEVITPGDETSTESTGASGPGFTVVGALVAVAVVALLGRRRF